MSIEHCRLCNKERYKRCALTIMYKILLDCIEHYSLLGAAAVHSLSCLWHSFCVEAYLSVAGSAASAGLTLRGSGLTEGSPAASRTSISCSLPSIPTRPFVPGSRGFRFLIARLSKLVQYDCSSSSDLMTRSASSSSSSSSPTPEPPSEDEVLAHAARMGERWGARCVLERTALATSRGEAAKDEAARASARSWWRVLRRHGRRSAMAAPALAVLNIRTALHPNIRPRHVTLLL